VEEVPQPRLVVPDRLQFLNNYSIELAGVLPARNCTGDRTSARPQLAPTGITPGRRPAACSKSNRPWDSRTTSVIGPPVCILPRSPIITSGPFQTLQRRIQEAGHLLIAEVVVDQRLETASPSRSRTGVSHKDRRPPTLLLSVPGLLLHHKRLTPMSPTPSHQGAISKPLSSISSQVRAPPARFF